VFAFAFALAASSVSAVVFIPLKSIKEGGGVTPPIIAAAAGCLMSWKHQLFTYEAATEQKMLDTVIAALDKDFGLVALQGHGSAMTLDQCSDAEKPEVFAKFLKPFVGHLKEVSSYGCHTGRGFTQKLYDLLIADGHKGVVVFGPEFQLVMDCGGPFLGHGRIFLNAQNLDLATPDWRTMRDLYQKNLLLKPAAFWVEQQAVFGTANPTAQVDAFRALSAKLAHEYTPLWREFITYCDTTHHYMYPNGKGWIRFPALNFLFRQQFKNKIARNREVPSHPSSLQ